MGLLRQSVFGPLAGYGDINGAERLSQDPVMRAIVDRIGLQRSTASTSRRGRFETVWLASNDNLVLRFLGVFPAFGFFSMILSAVANQMQGFGFSL